MYEALKAAAVFGPAVYRLPDETIGRLELPPAQPRRAAADYVVRDAAAGDARKFWLATEACNGYLPSWGQQGGKAAAPCCRESSAYCGC